MRVELKGVHRVRAKRADGSIATYYYAWRGGPRLTGQPGTPEFFSSFKAAVDARRTPPPGQFRTVISAFKASADFKRLAVRTQSDYLKHITAIEPKFGSMPLAAFAERNKRITRGVFKAWRDELATRSQRQADYAWTILARIISWGLDRGLLDTNPAEKGGRLYRADRNDKVWTAVDEAAFLERAPPHLHLALLLALWTGQRQGDLLKLTWNQYDGTYLKLRQSKTGRRVKIPLGGPLRAALDIEREKKRGALVLLNSDGQSWTEDGFRSSWRKACNKAEVQDVTFHDLRGSAVTRLALAGASVPEIAAFTGHSLRDVQEVLDAHYLSRDVHLAESAIRKLERGEG
jgi:integrase